MVERKGEEKGFWCVYVCVYRCSGLGKQCKGKSTEKFRNKRSNNIWQV